MRERKKERNENNKPDNTIACTKFIPFIVNKKSACTDRILGSQRVHARVTIHFLCSDKYNRKIDGDSDQTSPPASFGSWMGLPIYNIVIKSIIYFSQMSMVTRFWLLYHMFKRGYAATLYLMVLKALPP